MKLKRSKLSKYQKPKGNNIYKMNEDNFNELVGKSNVLILMHPETKGSKTATVQTGFNFEVTEEEIVLLHSYLPQISDMLLKSELARFINDNTIVAVYGVLTFETGNFTALCYRPIFPEVPLALSESGWKEGIEEFCERKLNEYREAI